MSWLFSRVLVEEYLQENSSDGELLRQWSGNPMPQAFLSPDRMTAFSRLSRFGMTFKPLTDATSEAVLTWFLAGFPVRTSALQERAQESTGNAPECGSTWRGSLAKFDPVSCSWKTAQLSLIEDLEPCSVTWPRSGMTVDGLCLEQATSGRLTCERGYGLWPTPTVCGNHNRKGASKTSGDGLATAVKKYPTPTAGADCLGGWGGSNARTTMRKLVPESELYGPLNPMWVEWLMGWPLGWTDLKPLETDKFRNVRQQLGECLEACE